MERVNESSCIPKRYKVYYDRKEEVIMRKIILASASPRRKELLERAGVDFEVLPAGNFAEYKKMRLEGFEEGKINSKR